MAIVALTFPTLKTDAASIEEAERLHPSIAQKLTDPNPGLLNAFRGWVLYDDDKYVRDEYIETLVLEWQDETSFNQFLGSNQFSDFISLAIPLLAEEPELQLYETNTTPKDAVSAHVVEIIRVSLRDAENIKTAEKVWAKLSQITSGEEIENSVSVSYGKSLNLKTCVIAGILGWASTEQRSNISRQSEFLEGLKELKSIGQVSQFVVDVAPLALPVRERAS